ncbi:MAG: hypothetical protein K8W52_15895 [Deltaproteobacteria bacterium]|nr:hypothetical protein [Deltaproteobacteria bacterium]
MSRIPWLITITTSVGLFGLTQTSCTTVECGDGTIERNGACEPADTATNDAVCGPGTHLEQMLCVPDAETVCDPASTTEEVDPVTHVVTCVGTGMSGCGTALACGNASGGKMNVCGQLIDAETNQPIAQAGATGAPCDLANPAATGPCSMIVNFYDAIQFVTSQSPMKLNDPVANPVYIDDCGRFRIKNLPVPSNGFLGIEIDDNGGADVHTRSGVAIAVAPNKTFAVEAYSVKKTTDAAWTAAVGLGPSPSLGDRGAWLGIFRYNSQPVEGVTVTRNGSPVPAADDFAFSDNSTTARTTPVASGTPQVTGKNGSMLLLNSTLVGHSGTGGTGVPGTCKWASALGDSVTNAYIIQTRDAVLATDTTVLCPP